MADITRKNAVLSWVYSGGTVALNTDFRNIGTDESVDLVMVAAGNDTDKTYLATLKDGVISYSGLLQANGTVIKQALEAGGVGTLIFSPEGTASGKPKETYPCISMGAKVAYPYDNVVEVSCDFQKNGARVDSSN